MNELNPYQPSQTEELQVVSGVPSWLAKPWLSTKQFIEEPAPPVETWSSAIGQVYRWLVLMHVFNLLPFFVLWKACRRWRTCVVTMLLVSVFVTVFIFSALMIFVFVSERVSWTIK